ncbi:hypothetical protein [Pseudoroseicyclus aestuarii]|uniref:Uncharacterized protein n=1 Tax=Pseudoroseicyclus aestuarii TaxID=1795041 RepID=A0A318SRR3_9RHOB|nr:hypothetical protein [Pseudoroseicyclus aestuarii]PYE84373.1 hypothetical protein DFP88_102171 [Pseudoroseicyclus aestuarii]
MLLSILAAPACAAGDLDLPVPGGFVAARAEATARLAGAEGAASEAEALVEMAALSLAEGLIPEGLSLVQAVDPAQLADPARHAALLAALRLADGTAPPDGTLPDDPLWDVLDRIRRGQETAADLAAAWDVLAGYPDPLASRLLLPLLEAAVEARRMPLAETMARRAEAMPELRRSGHLGYILGRAAELNGDLPAAFQAWNDAAALSDAGAQRARLALVGLGARTGTLTLDEQREMLRAMLPLWQGDALHREALDRLAAVEHALGDDLAALEVLAEVLSRWPGDTRASAEARALLQGWYGDAATRDLGALIAGHDRLDPRFGFFPGYDRQAEVYARRLSESGASGRAAAAFGTIRGRLEVLRRLGVQEVAPERIDALRLAEAEALLQGQQIEAAAALMETPFTAQDPGLRMRIDHLRRVIAARSGGALSPEETARLDAETQRLVAADRLAQGDWEGAKTLYMALWQAEALEVGDRMNLLLAAHRSGDDAVLASLAEAFPAMTDLPVWPQIGQQAAGPPPQVPMQRSQVREALEASAARLRALIPAPE